MSPYVLFFGGYKATLTDINVWCASAAAQKANVTFDGYPWPSGAKDRLANRVQLTSDGHRAYLDAVAGSFGSEVDYAQLVKMYGPSMEGKRGSAERRYSPMPSARISACVCTPGALLASRMRSQRRSKTTRIQSSYLRCTTILFASIRRCGPRQRWPRYHQTPLGNR